LALFYIPSNPGFVTLQVPHLPVSIQYQAPAILREILEGDPETQLAIRRTITADRVASGTERILTHAYVEILARLLQREQAREYRRVALGGHAAVVESDVVRYAVG
jgi:hypothetical protein